jgi:hypothetical protein
VEDSRLDVAASATREGVLHAFPGSIRSTAAQVVELIPAPPRADLVPRGLVGELLVEGQRVLIPYRIYSQEPAASVAASLDQEATVVLACAYTRHNDGHIRERSVLRVIGVDRPWVVPIVVQLLAEYVVEISESVLERLDELQRETYRRFAAANESFMQLTRDHIVSYWACYYRAEYRLPAYPPVRVLDGAWTVEWTRRATSARPRRSPDVATWCECRFRHEPTSSGRVDASRSDRQRRIRHHPERNNGGLPHASHCGYEEPWRHLVKAWPRRVVSITSGVLAVAAVLGAFQVPEGPMITIDNRGLLGAIDVSGAPWASFRLWLRLLVLGIGIALALVVRSFDPSKRSVSLAWAAGVLVSCCVLVALLYPTGPPNLPPRPCLPGGSVGPTAAACRIYYSDHQPGPAYIGLRLGFVAGGLVVGLGLLAVATVVGGVSLLAGIKTGCI